MQVTESIIMFIYLVVLTVIGIYFYRRARQSESDYFTAGQSINTFVGAFAILRQLPVRVRYLVQSAQVLP